MEGSCKNKDRIEKAKITKRMYIMKTDLLKLFTTYCFFHSPLPFEHPYLPLARGSKGVQKEA